MNDRFKFRVWNKHINEYCNIQNLFILPTGETGYFITDGSYPHQRKFMHQEDMIIEMSTGFSDKNGNLIYEGDILTEFYNPQVNYIIKWDEKDAKFGLWYDDHFIVGRISRDGGNLCWLPSEFVITGNIHEQAEQKDK